MAVFGSFYRISRLRLAALRYAWDDKCRESGGEIWSLKNTIAARI